MLSAVIGEALAAVTPAKGRQVFAQTFQAFCQEKACFCQVFPKILLAVLRNFKGLRGGKSFFRGKRVLSSF